MKKPNFAPWPSFDREIVKAVSDILRSGKVSQWTGPNVYAFEEEYAKFGDKTAPIQFVQSPNALYRFKELLAFPHLVIRVNDVGI